jgi:hypothetical protein
MVMATTKRVDKMAKKDPAKRWAQVKFFIWKPPGRIKAMVTAANKPLIEAMAMGVQWMDFMKTPEVLHSAAAKTRNNTAFDLGCMSKTLFRFK